MAKTTTKSVTKQKLNETKEKGKKGGLGIAPTAFGAMAGAAIGGLAGLALGSETARKKLALARDKAISTAGEVFSNLETQTENLQEEAEKATSVLHQAKTITKKSTAGRRTKTKK